MGRIRINDLARELEVKSKAILETLPQIDFHEKKSHSSSLEDEIADKVRAHLTAAQEQKVPPQAPSKAAPPGRLPEKVQVKRPETRPELPPLRRSLEDIKAEMRKKVSAPAARVALKVPPPLLARRSATSPVTARPTPAAEPVPHIVSPTVSQPIPATETLSAPTASAGAGVKKMAAAQRAPTTTAKRTKTSKLADATKPLYSLAAPRVPGRARPGMVRRPGEPHPVRPSVVRSPTSAAGRSATAPGARPSAFRGRPPRPSAAAPLQKPPEPEVVPITRKITIADAINVKELSEKLGVKVRDVITKLLVRGVLVNINQMLESSLATEISLSYGAETEVVSYEEEVQQEVQEVEKPENLQPRAPVVTIMGHVDHGKTSLLDAIRHTNVIGQEAGGITQHIGAYRVEVRARPVVFLDTPGHEAFTLMRARGAKVTDIVILVVAADDGVMPQTMEAIAHARAAKVPILVAINKVDKPNALPDRVKKQLADQGLNPEDWGGDTVMVEVSAKERKNLDHLLEMILLVSDLQENKANPNQLAKGTILEAKLDRGRGSVASVLIQTGTLRTGDNFIAGPMYGKVRAMFDEHGQSIERAGPSVPVEVLGLESVPQVGDSFQVIEDTAKAKQITRFRQSRLREATMAKTARVSLEQLQEQMSAGEVKELPLILKADVQGSVEVLVDTLNKCSTEKVKIKIVHSAVGAITQTDVLLASASNAIIIGFNVRPERKAVVLAGMEKVNLRLHTVIYHLTEEIQKAMAGLLTVTTREVPLGRIEIRETFRIRKVGNVAGSFVADGKATRNAQVRLLRDNTVVYQGRIRSLRRFKDDIEEVKSGLECGIILENFNDVKPGDVLEPYVVEKVAEPILA